MNFTDKMNRECRCITVDTAQLKSALTAEVFGGDILAAYPNLFSASPVFIAKEQVAYMSSVIRAVETVIRSASYQEAVAAWLPPIARLSHGPTGVFFGYDFHLAAGKAGLIEINTNAGGAMLNAALARAQRMCCDEVQPWLNGPTGVPDRTVLFIDSFRRDWALQRGGRTLRTIAIVDDEPDKQFLYPEFLMFARLFAQHGIEAVVADASALEFSGGVLSYRNKPIDLVYNRLTDFYFEEERHAALRDAYIEGAAVVTPHPRAYGLYADKRNLTVLTNGSLLRNWGIAEETVRTLEEGIPRTLLVEDSLRDFLWSTRKKYFFKPATGYGSKAAYRGDKLTKGTWEEMKSRPYVAQEILHPSERTIDVAGEVVALKVDIRNYTYQGEVQLLAARLYQGQTTNFRTAGGGFAPVFTEAIVTP